MGAHWADGSPGPESVSPEERHEAGLSMRYAHLKRCAGELNDDDQVYVEHMLSDVAEDLKDKGLPDASSMNRVTSEELATDGDSEGRKGICTYNFHRPILNNQFLNFRIKLF